jgi:hypothetical protein
VASVECIARLDRLVQLERIAPEGFVARRVEPEREPAFVEAAIEELGTREYREIKRLPSLFGASDESAPLQIPLVWARTVPSRSHPASQKCNRRKDQRWRSVVLRISE